ncbi:MAG: hypothetical protein LHV68_11260 [Elusimicrobia bacterium]|nr:hypothetical protein [Candidatus Liberimonas magnetica]
MELTPQQKEAIYLEEKSRMCDNGGCSAELLFVFNVIAAAALAGIYFVAKTPKKRMISIDAIHKAYSGLSPDEF